MSRSVLRIDTPDGCEMRPSFSSDKFYARQRGAALRRLAIAMKAEKSPAVLNRLQMITRFVEGVMSVEQIARHARVSRTTAFAYWRKYRLSGLKNLVTPQSIGRPRAMPAIVRERFDHLAQPDPYNGGQVMVYVVEREQLVFRILGARFPLWKVSRWLGQYIRENQLLDRTYRFRTIRAAFSRLPERDRLHYSDNSNVHLGWDERLLAETLSYASDLNPDDRELRRWALAVRFDVSRSEVVFNDEDDRESAKVIWNAPALTTLASASTS